MPYALKVWDILKLHGLGLDQESYEEESGLMGSLIKALEKPEIAEAITILKQEQVVAYLKDSHAGFSALYQTAVETEAGKENIISATKLKKGTLAKLKSVVEYLNPIVRSKPEIYGTVHAEMAELINNLNHKIRLRNK